MDALKLLTEHKGDVNLPAKNSATALLMAAQDGHLDIVSHLLEASAEVNVRANTGATPLYQACSRNHLAVAKLLMRHGADPVLEFTHPDDGERFTPRQGAEDHGHHKVVKYLDAVRGFTAVHFSCEARDPKALTALLRLDSTDAYATTPHFGGGYSASST